MRYEYRLRLMEMLRLERDAEWEDPVARVNFWALLCSLGALPIMLLMDVLDDKYNSRKALMGLLVAATVCVVRFVYLTVRRLRKVHRRFGSIWSSPSHVLDFLPARFEFTYDGRVDSSQWETVELFEKRGFFGFRLHKTWMCPLPKRVIPPDELPKLMAFLAERIPPKPSAPAHSPLDPPVA